MKRLKRIIFNILAVVMVFGMCLGLTACEDIKKLQVTISVYDADEGQIVDKTLKVDLYRHLAPKTVDHIIKNCVNNKYYDNAILYKQNEGVMMGDIFYDEATGTFVKKGTLAPTVKGEFTNNGVKGTNLKVKAGSVVLWRTYGVKDSSSTNTYFNTGRATWLMPTSSSTSRDGFYAVFGQFDTKSKAWTAITSILNSSSDSDIEFIEYTVYYTEEEGGYNEAKEDCNLEFHCVKTADLPEDFSKTANESHYFVPEGSEYVEYQKRTISIPYFNEGSALALRIKSIKLV